MTNENSRAEPSGPRAASASGATYYALLGAQTVSQIGSQISEYAVGIAIFHATGRATPLALVLFFQTLPFLFGGLFGALADRFDRRTIMLIANLGFIAASSLLLASFVSGVFQLWHLYVLTLASASFAALERPAFQACIATLVPESGRDRANAIGQMSAPAAGMAAPALAGVLYALVGVTGAIGIDIATFVATIAVLMIVRIPRPAETAEGRAMRGAVWRQVFDGFRYLLARPALLAFCGYVSVINLFANTAMALLTPYVLARTGDVRWFGVVLLAMNAGAIVGALVIGAGARIGSRMNTIMFGIVGGGVFICLAGVARNAPELGGSLFLMSFALAFANAPYWSMMQAKVAPDVQGRVFATLLQIGILLSPLAFLAAGPLADHVFEPARREPIWRSVSWLTGAGPGAGIGLIFVVTGALVLTLSIAAYAIPVVRRLEEDLPDHEAGAKS